MKPYKIIIFIIIGCLLSCIKDKAVIIPAKSKGYLYFCAKTTTKDAYQVYRYHLDELKIDTITNNKAFNYWWVELSPNKSELVLLRSPVSSKKDQFDYENCEMITCKADGKSEEIILKDNQYDWFAFGNPHWSSDNTKILMIAQSKNQTEPFRLYSILKDGKSPKLLYDNYAIDGHWNLNGTKVCFIGIDSSGFKNLKDFEVFEADYDSNTEKLKNIKQLTKDRNRNQDPCYSADGSKIIYSSGNEKYSDADLVSLDLKTKTNTILMNDKGIHGGPIQSNQNDEVYYHSVYPLKSKFFISKYDLKNKTNVVILKSPKIHYISPYYTDIVMP